MKEHTKKIILVINSVLMVTVILGGVYIYWLLNYTPLTNNPVVIPPVAATENLSIKNNSPQPEIINLEDQLKANLEDESTPLMIDGDVFNILLIGSDLATATDPGRSDSMILLSINKKTREITLTSFLRDLYVSIPGYGDNRLNAAYNEGGPDLLRQTIEENFKVKIDRYASVNFLSFVDVIDQLGGVTVTITDEELPYVNRYIKEVNHLKGLPKDDGLLPAAGENLHLSGKQALGYARIRYIGTDFGRTQRQRTVLSQVFDQVKSLNLIEQNKIMNEVLSDVSTDLTKGEAISLVLDLVSFKNYDVKQLTVPIEGSYKDMVIRRMEVLGVDVNANVDEIRKTIYGGSDAVQTPPGAE